MNLRRAVAELRGALGAVPAPRSSRRPWVELQPDGWPLVCVNAGADPGHDCALGRCVLLPVLEGEDGEPDFSTLTGADREAVLAALGGP